MGYQKILDLKGTQKLGEKTSQMMKSSLEMWNKGVLTTQNNESKSQQPPKHLLTQKASLHAKHFQFIIIHKKREETIWIGMDYKDQNGVRKK